MSWNLTNLGTILENLGDDLEAKRETDRLLHLDASCALQALNVIQLMFT